MPGLPEIIKYATASTANLIASALVLVIALYFAFRLVYALIHHSAHFSQGLLGILKTAVHELFGGKDVAPYERVNGFIVVVLGLCTIAYLVLVVTESVGLVGHGLSAGVVATFLFLLVLLAATGLACVRFVLHHKEDVATARRLGRGPGRSQ